MPRQLFDNALQAVYDSSITYPTVDFPIKYVGDKETPPWFESVNGVRFQWTEAGAGYLSERNTRYKYATFTKLVRDGAWWELEQLANKAIDAIKGAGKGLIFAMVDDLVVGVLRHYNVVPHIQLLRAVEEASLANDVIGWALNDHYLRLDVATAVIASSEHGELFVGTRILNGHSGHHALQYHTLVKARGYEFELKNKTGRARHLTGVTELKENLRVTLDAIGTVKIDHTLLGMSVPVFVAKLRTGVKDLTMRQESLLHLLESTDLDNAFDAFVLLGQYASTKGYSTAVAGLLDPLVKSLLWTENTALD
jgi:hypothetical protein